MPRREAARIATPERVPNLVTITQFRQDFGIVRDGPWRAPKLNISCARCEVTGTSLSCGSGAKGNFRFVKRELFTICWVEDFTLKVMLTLAAWAGEQFPTTPS